MSCKIPLRLPAFLLALAAWSGAAPLQADIISINFTGGNGGPFPLQTTDAAGVTAARAAEQSAALLEDPFVRNWNNADGTSGSLPALTLASGGPALGVSAAWTAPSIWSINTTVGSNLSGGANPQMMRGYLDFSGNGDGAQTTVTVSGLVPLGASYQVIVYFDGDNVGAWRVGQYTLNDGFTNTSVTGEDSENVNFNSGGGNNANGLFQMPAPGGSGNVNWPNHPNNSEGNYLVFSGLTGSSFTLTAVGGSNAGGTPGVRRAPVNGIQIVGVVPEPGSLALLTLGLGALRWARRRG
jgi:hypothetical protein